jgi:hypothetical protein
MGAVEGPSEEPTPASVRQAMASAAIDDELLEWPPRSVRFDRRDPRTGSRPVGGRRSFAPEGLSEPWETAGLDPR